MLFWELTLYLLEALVIPEKGLVKIGVSVKGHLRDFREVDYLPANKAVFQKIN